MTPDSNAVEAVLQKQFDLINRIVQELQPSGHFESDDQASCRISMSQNCVLASLIKGQSRHLQHTYEYNNETKQSIMH
jgi:hypothetical protein